MKLIRTEKEFKKENLPLDFLRRATSLGGLSSIPLKYQMEDFEVIENWKGVMPGGSVHPWSDEHAKEGFTKQRDSVYINNLKGFDTNIVVWESGKIQGYFKKSFKQQYASDPVKWCNLLLEYGFLKFEE